MMDTKPISQELNPEQNNAVLATEGYIRVIAGPGVGKTRVLTERMIYIIQQLGIKPENILCVTFTNKAANEMADRVANVLDYRPENICTFHRFCYRFLQRHINVLNYPDNFLMMDGEYQQFIF
jgi:DNA helicase-2/ATP-dependent DNA helicase PcrA